jgi:hypothetical protein
MSQIVQFPATLLPTMVNLLTPGTDTVIQAASAIAAQTHADGVYQATFAAVPNGQYTVSALDAGGHGIIVDAVAITAASGTFSSEGMGFAALNAGGSSGATADQLLNASVGSRPAGSLGAFVARIGQVTLQWSGPVLGNGDVQIVRGNDYFAADSYSIDLPAPASKFGDLTAATGITLTAKSPSDVIVFGPIAGSVINADTESQALRFEPTATQTTVPTANESGPAYLYEALCLRPTSARKLTTARGALTVLDNVPLP